MNDKLQEIREKVLLKLKDVKSLDDAKSIKVEYLGKKGALTEILRGLGSVAAEERPKIGKMVNEVRADLEEKLNTRLAELEKRKLADKLAKEKVDITMPGRKPQEGTFTSCYFNPAGNEKDFYAYGL
jgi:phenylalanyl-tRNA synthetase alpha chain